MKIDRQAVGSDYLNAKFIQDNKVAEVKLASDVREESNRFDQNKKQFVVDVTYQGLVKGSPNRWKLGGAAINALIDKFGDDTAKWVDQTIPITVGGEGMYQHVTVDTLRL